MLKNITTNKALGYTDDQWGALIEGNGLLLTWFIEWNKGDRQEANILEFFSRKYQQSSGGEPYPMGGKVSLDGKYVSRGDDPLEPYFIINTDDGVGYVYPYAFVALPKKSGGHTIVRMD